MRKETEIDLAVAEAVGSKYDNACKRLFQNREIIAPVLKEVVPEYKNSTVEEIIRYIDADSIEDIPVDDIPAGVGRLQTEIGSVRDKLIRYVKICVSIFILIWKYRIITGLQTRRIRS